MCHFYADWHDFWMTLLLYENSDLNILNYWYQCNGNEWRLQNISPLGIKALQYIFHKLH